MSRWCQALARAMVLSQVLLGGHVVWRLARTARGRRIGAEPDASPGGERVTVIVPVLNEEHRLAPCLDGLVAQGGEVAEVLVVDGGSTDGTRGLIEAAARRDARVRLLAASPIPPGWNGKAHGLQVGLECAATSSAWVLTVDADVRPVPALARSLLEHARAERVEALSVATLQRLSGAAEGLLHPALLATLVYRFGIPGHATDRVQAVQANGQCFLARRDVLGRVGGFASVRDSLNEDVTLARSLAAAGCRVGFYETDGLAEVAMYAGWRDAWRNWTRSLPLRDRYAGLAGWLGLAEVALVQALPLPLAMGLWLRGRRAKPPLAASMLRGNRWLPFVSLQYWGGEEALRPLLIVNAGLAAVRLGVLGGMARAYPGRPWTYWLSPVCDPAAAVGVWWSAFRRRHAWRGRTVVRGGPR